MSEKTLTAVQAREISKAEFPKRIERNFYWAMRRISESAASGGSRSTAVLTEEEAVHVLPRLVELGYKIAKREDGLSYLVTW